MPNQTFFNLPQEKQALLMSAVKREFSRVPLNEASIANMIKDAGIARGSFYQYFEDKEDAFFYLLEKQMEGHNRAFILTLRENNGDLFDSFISFFQRMLMEFKDQDNLGFFKNVFLNLNYKMESKLTKGFNKSEHEKQFLEFMPEINLDKLNIENEEEVAHIFKIIAAVTTHNLMQHFAKKISYEEAIKHYTFEINLLKKGLYKNMDK